MTDWQPTGQQIVEMAFRDFERWQLHQPPEIRRMDETRQALHYSNDEEWHDKPSEAQYANKRATGD